MELQGLSKKIYIEPQPLTDEDPPAYDRRILDALAEKEIEAAITLPVLRRLYPLCDQADWKLTASLSWDGSSWQVTDLETGDTTASHYGLAVDLGSTSVVIQLINCNTGEVLAEASTYNHQITYGEDILTRIFYSKDHPQHLEEIRRSTVDTFVECMDKLEEKTGIDTRKCLSMVVAGNTTMIHFLLGLDAFCVFSAPYSVRTLAPGFFKASDLDIPISGYVYCYPARANYLGGDIISGMVSVGVHKKDEVSLFFDVGTNGELVVGSKDFLLCGAGAAGPALEGGVVKTGMRAAPGAVEGVHLQDGEFHLDVIGGEAPKGICGSGIIDMLSELFINGWLDIRGKLCPERSDKITEVDGEMAVCYAPGLYFFQSDVEEFVRTKAAAYTMIEYMLQVAGMGLEDVRDFYMAGAFGTHVNRESAVNIGMYPDVELERIHTVGNSSLTGARMLLTDKSILDELDDILELMNYVQFGAVEDFLQIMLAAQALPHTDYRRYPSVIRRLQENGIELC